MVTLETLGNLGEFVGGAAVVISLLYLAFQIRQNSKTVRVAAYHSFNEANARVLLAMAQGPSPAHTLTKGIPDIHALDSAESFQFITLVVSLLQSFQTAYFQHRDGLLPNDLWRRHRAVARWWLSHPGIQSSMKMISGGFDQDFLREIAPRTSTNTTGSGESPAV